MKETLRIESVKLGETNNQINPPLEVTPVKHLSFRAPSPRKLTISSLQLHGSNTKYSCHHPITLTNDDCCLHCKINKWLMEVHHSV